MLQEHGHLTDFVAHRVCWMLRDDLILTHAIGDGLTALAYYLIPITLFYILRKFNFDGRLKLVLFVYAAFILLCGTTHIMDVLMIWKINYYLLAFDGYLRVLTGVFSLVSAGVTIWAASNFVSLYAQFKAVFERMKKERRDNQRISNETWTEFKSAMASVEDLLQRGK
jgi:hypothetical protein